MHPQWKINMDFFTNDAPRYPQKLTFRILCGFFVHKWCSMLIPKLKIWITYRLDEWPFSPNRNRNRYPDCNLTRSTNRTLIVPQTRVKSFSNPFLISSRNGSVLIELGPSVSFILHNAKCSVSSSVKLSFKYKNGRLSSSRNIVRRSFLTFWGHWDHYNYTPCTLRLRTVKLLVVIFGRLSYTFLWDKICNLSVQPVYMDDQRIRTVHLMDAFRQRIIKNIKMWTAGQMEESPSVEAWSNLKFHMVQ